MFIKEYIIALILLITFVYLIIITPVNSHEAPSGWQYDHFCCHNQDCAPINKIEQDPNTSGLNVKTTIVTKHGAGIVTPNTRWLQSKDEKDHACILNGRVICFYGAMKF